MASSPVTAPTSTYNNEQQLPSSPKTKIPKNAAAYQTETQDYDLRSQINIQLLDNGHINLIHETLLHALHAHPSDWPSKIQAHALNLLRNGEVTTFPNLMKRVLADIRMDQKRNSGRGDDGLALPAVVIEEGVRVTRESLEQVCEVVGGNN